MILVDKIVSLIDKIYNLIYPPRPKNRRMKKILSIVFMILLFNNCTIPLPPVGEGVTRYQVKNLALFFDFDNGIFWASTGPGEGHEVKVYKQEYPIYYFCVGPNAEYFQRTVINKGDRFMVIIDRETTQVTIKDTILENFYRVRFPQVVVDFDLQLGRIYYHSIHQETYEIEVTDLEGGSFLVDRKTIGCYESKATRITNLRRKRRYGITVKKGGKTVEYQEVKLN
jgi:hypothetical protein